MFIALLILIQVHHTVESPSHESCSPIRIAELVQQSEVLAVEIESATVLLDTIRKTMPEPVVEKDKIIVARYSELLARKNDILIRKSETTRNYLTLVKENAELERQLKEIEKILTEFRTEESVLTQITQTLQNEQKTLEQQITELQNIGRSTEADVAQKTDRLQNPDSHSRKEELHLPKMQDSGYLRPFYLVLRFNRLYVVENRSDFNNIGPNGHYLGVPKNDRGIMVGDYDAAKRQIRNIFQSVSPSSHYIGVFVYGDSVDSFYIVRNEIMGAGFRYELIPTPDDFPWTFEIGGGSVQIQ